MNRIKSIDITRGLIMVIMALDHVREYMHTTSMTMDPTNLETTTAGLFLTRWITHLCAPAFVFLAGASAYLSYRKRKDISQSRKFLLTRGIWLVILEFTIINFALWFDLRFRLMIMEVISAIGLSFIVLSLLLKLKPGIIGAIGILLIFSHDLLSGIKLPENQAAAFLASVLFRPGMFNLTSGLSFFTAYPLIPWLGIMLTGFACGEFFEKPAERRKKIFLQAGSLCIFLFVVIRLANYYGDPAPWSVQKTPFFTFLSFINVSKYPPSLLFTLLFTGLTFIILYISEKADQKLAGTLSVYGKVPFFYFIVHLYLIHILMFLMLFLQGKGMNDLVFGVFENGRPKTGVGVNLTGIYIIWISVVVALYPLCRWYGKFKEEHREKVWPRYL
jgi:uncharacterized membrane protein